MVKSIYFYHRNPPLQKDEFRRAPIVQEKYNAFRTKSAFEKLMVPGVFVK